MLKPKVLLVNDHPASLLALKTLLLSGPESGEYELITATSGAEALREVLRHRFAVILLDISMPGMDGFETAEIIHSHFRLASIPIIFITAHYADELNRLKGYEQGAVDYLITPVIPQVLRSKISVFIELAKKNIQLQSQKEALAMRNRDLQIQQMEDLKRINATLEEEIIERRQAEERAHELAIRDPLTGLMNRRSLAEHLEHATVRAARRGELLALLFLDMDRFKAINDTLGHDAGDELLCQVARRISAAVRESDVVARLGGDEFVVLMEDLPSYAAASEVARKIVKTYEEPFSVASQNVNTSVSIGISLFPQDGTSVNELMRSADLAMYHAKQERRGSVQFFHEELNARMVERSQLEQELQHALENDEFELYYQPKVDAATGRVAGVEALLRWHHPRLGLLSGGQFIPAALDTGKVVPIGEWVISAACAQAKLWQESGAGLPSIPIAVNIAIPQIYANLPEVIDRALREYGVPPSSLQLEITESLLIEDIERATSVLREISESGITIAIDDFGTGYSSLSVLKTLPIDVLKIDQSFVRDLGKDLGDNAIVAAIVNMARALALRVVAEGVETQEQLNILRQLGCDEHQGYFYSKPLPAALVAEQLGRTNSTSSTSHA
ncbi:GGDEF domain-containing response regulator [Noviherbaspirillum cavernae]|uniref:GGDEF domain-containing response regulator n=1 Tax=Noviherbaspirillum cavernae TaxID=2320862 RepID=A0A418X0T1_9BURK|nr:EAL domain-containing protein [Noviherbaspirillum cavernae]RJG06096.1 GGDEF domain-containing response regulator [Noviherbaspirillum cavernae]